MKTKNKHLVLNKKRISKFIDTYHILGGSGGEDENAVGQTTSAQTGPVCTENDGTNFDNMTSLTPYCLNAGSFNGCTA